MSVCLLHRPGAHWAPACHHALLLPLPRASQTLRGGEGERRGGVKERQEGEKKKRRRKSGGGEKRERMWPEPWVLAKSPSLPPSLPPPSLSTPSPAASLYTMAASLLKFHVIGSRAGSFVLSQCPGSGACCRRHTLQAKGWKTHSSCH